jgi:hypothetical protein
MLVNFNVGSAPIRSFRVAALCWATCATLTLGCSRQREPRDAAAPAAIEGGAKASTAAVSAEPSGLVGPTVQTALRLHLLAPAPGQRKTSSALHITRAELQSALDRAKLLLARSERSDNSWDHGDRPALIQTDHLRVRAQAGNDVVDAADDMRCNGGRGVGYLRSDAAAYLRAANEYIGMAARDLAKSAPNSEDWSAPVPEVHEEEGEGCGG